MARTAADGKQPHRTFPHHSSVSTGCGLLLLDPVQQYLETTSQLVLLFINMHLSLKVLSASPGYSIGGKIQEDPTQKNNIQVLKTIAANPAGARSSRGEVFAQFMVSWVHHCCK